VEFAASDDLNAAIAGAAVRIAFLDTQELDYTADTPYRQPLGGTQSALCYLAVELARLGHQVAVLNSTTLPGRYRDVQFIQLARVPADVLARSDFVVVLNSAYSLQLRRELGIRSPLVLWLSHAADQPIVAPLAQPEQRDAWGGFAFVSEWQQERFIEQFGIPRNKVRVLRNAISPSFAETPLAPAWFERQEPPVLTYTSTPFRGLDVLLLAFRIIRKEIPQLRLRVFSSMAIYHVKAAQDQYRPLYAQCIAEGVDYRGPLGQAKLAQELRGVAGLAYPSTFPETSCIAALEAMASGAFIFTTRLGALPETTSGFGFLVDAEPDPQILAERFAAMVVKAWHELAADPAAALQRREAQARFVRDRYRWSDRAAEWVSFLEQVH
jgi:glycosyltransferase involved in cell wall biosynthesis